MKVAARWMLVIVLAVAAGVGGTLLVQALTEDTPADCKMADRWVRAEAANLESESGPGPLLIATKAEIDWMDTLLDIRWKLCHP